MDVSKVDLLVHPGFSSTISKPLNSKKFEKLWSRFAEQAKAVRDDTSRILIAVPIYSYFSHSREEQVPEDNPVRKLLYDIRNQIEDMLQDRLVVVNGDSMNEVSMDEESPIRDRWFESLEEELQSRGFNISHETSALAYGQTFKSCVPRFSYNFAINYLLKERVDIDPLLTNLAVRASESTEERNKRIRDKLPELQDEFDEEFDMHINILPPNQSS